MNKFSSMRWRVILVAILCYGCMALPLFNLALARKIPEYQLKSGAMLNFLRGDIGWKEPENPLDPFKICIVGDDPFGKYLRGMAARKRAKNRPIELEYQQFTYKFNMRTCHILFISTSKEDSLDSVLEQIKGLPVLSVSDIENFATRGGMVGFFKKDGRIKIEISVKETKKTGLSIGSDLMRVAVKAD